MKRIKLIKTDTIFDIIIAFVNIKLKRMNKNYTMKTVNSQTLERRDGYVFYNNEGSDSYIKFQFLPEGIRIETVQPLKKIGLIITFILLGFSPISIYLKLEIDSLTIPVFAIIWFMVYHFGFDGLWWIRGYPRYIRDAIIEAIGKKINFSEINNIKSFLIIISAKKIQGPIDIKIANKAQFYIIYNKQKQHYDVWIENQISYYDYTINPSPTSIHFEMNLEDLSECVFSCIQKFNIAPKNIIVRGMSSYQ